MQKFEDLYKTSLEKNKVVHAYAEPWKPWREKDMAGTVKEAISWFKSIGKNKDLIGRSSYCKYEIDTEIVIDNDRGCRLEGYSGDCSIEKGTIDFDNLKGGEIFPVILHTHNEKFYTVACVCYRGWRMNILDPNQEGLAAFSVFMKQYHPGLIKILLTYPPFKTMKGYWSVRIANAFLEKSLNDNKPIEPEVVQDLCYLANGLHWASFDEQLIEDDVEAWTYGPQYQILDDFTRYPFCWTDKGITSCLPVFSTPKLTRKISNEEVKIIIQHKNKFYNVYKQMDKEEEDELINKFQERLNTGLDYKAKKTIDKVWEEYKKIWEEYKKTPRYGLERIARETGYGLERIARKKDGPWDLVYSEDKYNEIPQALIKDYFTNSNPPLKS